MNDYTFGNKIYQLRNQLKLSQSELAKLVGVSNKAVSKWENGKAKPTTNVLRELARIFQVDIDELLSLKAEENKMELTKIVITGGPCGGKSTAMDWIKRTFEERGYTVLFIPETATELINGGVAPWTCGTNYDYQRLQLKLQLEKEAIFEEAARTMGKEKVLIVCDRGILDNKAYMKEYEFQEVLKLYDTNEIEMRDHYGAVFHLVTAAKGAESFYTLANNSARTETPQQAALLDDKLIRAWSGHPHFRVIDNSTDFDEKMKRLVTEIALFLGEPEPFEIERKFLIEYPDMKWLENHPNCKKIEILQTYLKSDDNSEIRVRQRGVDGHYVYFKTIKKKISDIKREEIETHISKDEYLSLLMEADSSKRPIRKTRYCFLYENQYFELDIYPNWHHQAILEIELSDENQAIHFPKELKIIKEVTDDEHYKNAKLATL